MAAVWLDRTKLQWSYPWTCTFKDEIQRKESRGLSVSQKWGFALLSGFEGGCLALSA